MQLELCQLVETGQQDDRIFWEWWEARLATTQGEVVIARGEKYKDASTELNAKQSVWSIAAIVGPGPNATNAAIAETVRRSRAAHAKLIAQLLAEGWEPVGTNQEGQVVSLKRIRE